MFTVCFQPSSSSTRDCCPSISFVWWFLRLCMRLPLCGLDVHQLHGHTARHVTNCRQKIQKVKILKWQKCETFWPIIHEWLQRTDERTDKQEGHLNLERVHILLQQPSCLSAMFSLSGPRHPAALHMTKLVPVSAVIWPRMPCLPDLITLFSALCYTGCSGLSKSRLGFEPQQTRQSSGSGKKALFPFKVAGLSLVYKYMRYKLYIYNSSEGRSVPWGKMKRAGMIPQK